MRSACLGAYIGFFNAITCYCADFNGFKSVMMGSSGHGSSPNDFVVFQEVCGYTTLVLVVSGTLCHVSCDIIAFWTVSWLGSRPSEVCGPIQSKKLKD